MTDHQMNQRIAQYGDMTGDEIADGFVSLINALSVKQDDGSVILFDGVDHHTGEPVTFALDHHAAQGLANIVLNGELALVSIEQWQITYRGPANG